MMRAIAVLTAAYILIMAAAMSYLSDPGERISGMIFGETVFASPMIVACLLAKVVKRVDAREILLLFGIAYLILTVIVFVDTFTGEKDAQYQLALILIPLVGIPALAVAAVIAIFLNRAPAS